MKHNGKDINSMSRLEQLETMLIVRGYNREITDRVCKSVERYVHQVYTKEMLNTVVYGELLEHEMASPELLEHTLSDICRYYVELKDVLYGR